jgi:hypothetical protein
VTAVLKTVNPASLALTVRVASAPVVSEASVQNAVTVRRHAMLQSKTSRWPIKPRWQPPVVLVMTPNLCRTALLLMLAALKAAVSAVSVVSAIMVAAMTVVVNAAKRPTQALKKMAHLALKPFHQWPPS